MDTLVKALRQVVADTYAVIGQTHLCHWNCLLYTSPSPRDLSTSRMPSSA